MNGDANAIPGPDAYDFTMNTTATMLKAGPFTITDDQRDRLDRLDAAYRLMADDPQHCRPKIIINTPVAGLPNPKVQGEDPDLMLACELAQLQPHLDLGDDRVASVRAQFGTAQIASAFGCPLEHPTDNNPAAKAPAFRDTIELRAAPMPSLEAGILSRVAAFHHRWKKILPAGVRIQHPDIQSPFNTAHLVRGNDILTDFYDDPEAVGILLDRITDFMVDLTATWRGQIGATPGWFDDWGSLWKGGGRISNCSMHMIRPSLYRSHVLPRDLRLMQSIGGGRIHYCGTHGEVIDAFVSNPHVHGLDVDPKHHDIHALCERLPARVTLATTGANEEAPIIRRLLSGDWPAKRNLIINVWSRDLDTGRNLLADLRRSMPA